MSLEESIDRQENIKKQFEFYVSLHLRQSLY